MAKDKLTEYSATNASNDVIGDINVAEGMLPSAVNNALREQMTHLKNFADGTDAINALAVDNLKLDGNTISSTDTNGDITIDPDGTGDTIIASGNLGVGTTSPNSHLTTQTTSTSTSAFDFGVQVNNSFGSNSSIAAIGFHNRADVNSTGVGGAIAYVGGGASGGSGNITFNIKDGTDISNVVDVADEKMRITSAGKVLIATATAGGDGYTFDNSGFLTHARASGAAQSMVGFKNGGSFVGEIRTSTTATSYITSSDYRLKENVTYDWDATTRLKQLKPARFNFIADSDTTVDGFLAHEAQAVVPECVTGTKDEVDDDGNPVMQGIDQAKLVPLLCKTILELEARITALESN